MPNPEMGSLSCFSAQVQSSMGGLRIGGPRQPLHKPVKLIFCALGRINGSLVFNTGRPGRRLFPAGFRV